MKLLSIFVFSIPLFAQGTGSSPFTFLNNKTTGNPGEFHIMTNDGHYFGFQAQLTSTGNVLLGVPNTAPTPGTCLGYVSSSQLGWIACSGAGTLDPTLGVLMTSNTNAGVIGTGNGAHISWDPSNHWIDIQSWFGGSVAPVHINASQVQTQVLNFNSCLGTGCFTNGFNINNLTGNDATSIVDGLHEYFDTTLHIGNISAWFGGAVTALNLNITHLDAPSFHGDILLNTTPTICLSGQYARGVDIHANATGCTAGNLGTVTSISLNSPSATIGISGSPITTSGTISIDLPNSGATGGSCGGALFSCVLSFNTKGILTATGQAAILDPTLGLLMTTDTNSGVTGTGNGAHISWDPVNHYIDIQPWFSGATTSVHINGDLFDGTAHENLVLTTTPTLCAVGSYARGVNININATGCTVASSGTVTSVALSSPLSTITVSGSPITSFGTINIDLPTSGATGGSCGGPLLSCVLSFNTRGILTATGQANIVDFTLGQLITNSTNTGVTGTGDGGHIYWDTVNHWLQLSPWFSGATTSVRVNGDIFGNTTHSNIILSTTPTLCSSGFAAQGITTSGNATGCTAVGSGSIDPTLGLIVVNQTNTNVINTTNGMHIFFDPGSTTGHIRVYNGSNTLQPLVFDNSLVQFNADIFTQNVTPGLDNNYHIGTSSSRYTDVRAVTSHFGINPANTVSVETMHGTCASATCFSVIDAFAGNAGAYWTRSAGGTNLSPSTVTSGTIVGVFGSSGFDGSTWPGSTTAGMFTATTQTWSGSAHGMNIFFETTALNSTSPAVRMTIDSNGVTVNAMATGSSRAVCVTSAGLIYASTGLTCP